MLAAKGPLADRERLLEEGLGFGIVASIPIKKSKVVEIGSDVRVLMAQYLGSNCEGLLEEWFSFVIVLHGTIQGGEVADLAGNVGVLASKVLLA